MNNVILGTVPYLNARPLVARFLDEPVDVTLVEAVPSILARMLDRREVNAALVSSAVVLSDPSLCALPAGGVVSDGPVKSIRLMSRVRPEDIRTLALDTSSRTGIVLAQVMLNMVHGLKPDIVHHSPDIPGMLNVADAAAIIGDPALHAVIELERGALPMVKHDFDLGTLWRHHTGLPFVYALWTAPRDGDLARVNALLRWAVEWGVQNLDGIAESEAPKCGLTVRFCRGYLHENITYDLGPREWEGLNLFRANAVRLGLLPPCTHPIVCDGCGI